MAIKPILQFRNQDSTRDLNTTQARIVDRAVFDGGALTPSGVSLQVSVAPFIASGYDGMVAVSDTMEVRSIPSPAVIGPNRISYLVLHLEYRSLTTPIVNLQVIPETTWTTSISRNYFVTFAKFSVPFGATSLTDPGVEIDYSVGDWADKLGKTGWRMPVDTVASLPVTQNRDGDVRIAFDTRLAYVWNASASSWTPMGGAVNLADVAARSAESRHQFHRVTSGSGLLNEIPQSLGASGTLLPGFSSAGDSLRDADIPIKFPLTPIPGVANTCTVSGCHYLVNGHFIKTHADTIVFPAAGPGQRFDLLILEAWRELITAPSSETYDDEGGSSTLFASVRQALEQMQEQGGSISSYDLSEMEVYDSTSFVVTRYQYRIAEDVNISVLSDSSSVASSITNLDGNTFGLGANTDQKLWQALSSSSVDGVSWALPLVVVRRTSAELSGPPFIDTYRGDERYIFDVCPRAELGMGLFEVQETVKLGAEHRALVSREEAPSGFVNGTGDAISITDGSLQIPSSVVRVQGRDLCWDNSVSVPLLVPPVTGARTDLLVLEVFETAHPPPDRNAEAAPELRSLRRQGPVTTQWVGKFRFFPLILNSLQTTVEGAMADATVPYSAVSGDPALWSRATVPASGEAALAPVWALPVCLLHRRNTGAYVLSPSGQNGADRSLFPGLPNQPATFPYEGELLDVRARSVTSSEELQRILEESFDRLIAGDLRTNMRTHPVATNVTGTRLLQVDELGPSATSGAHLIPRAPNGSQTVWSESDEAELFTWSFLNMGIDHSDSTGVFMWTAATNTLSIDLPSGYMLSVEGQRPAIPYGPQKFVAYSIDGSVLGDRRPIPLVHTYHSGITPTFWYVQGDQIDPQPMRHTEVQLSLDPLASATYTSSEALVIIGVWAVKRNHEAGRTTVLNSYTNNRGLFAVPDLVHRIEYSLTGAAPFSRAWVGVPLNYIDVSVVGDEIVIDRTTLFAGGSISAEIASNELALETYAVAGISLDTTSVDDKIRYIQFTNDAGTAPAFNGVRIEFQPGSIPLGTTARVTLISTGDLVNRWFEVDPESKQVRGPYRVASNQFSIDDSAVHKTFAAPSPLCPWGDCGVSVVGGVTSGESFAAASFADSALFGGTELSFYSAGTLGSAWEIWFDSADRDPTSNISSGQEVSLQEAVDTTGSPMNLGAYSSLYSCRYAYTSGSFGTHNAVLVGPVRVPLVTGARVRVYYEYTPYQGITQDLESKINGTVEGISDQLVFTNGPNNSWIDYRILGTSLLRDAHSLTPPGVYNRVGSSGIDMGLLYSKGRVVNRYFSSAGPNYRGYFVRSDLSQFYRPEDRPVLAVSQRLPFPTKASNGTSVGTGYSPESFLSHASLVTASVVRPIPPTTAYPRNEASPWLLEWSGVTFDESMWRSQLAGTTLYFPLPINLGEEIVGLTIEAESAGPSGLLTCSFVRKDRRTGNFTSPFNTFYVDVEGPANTRRLCEVFTGASSSLAEETLLAITCSTSNIRVGQLTASVVSNNLFTHEGTTLIRYPYNDVTSKGPGKLIRKGLRIAVPETWTTEFASYESSLIKDGREDYPGVSPARGRALVAPLLGGEFYGSGLIGYVPGGDSTLSPFMLRGYSAAPSPTGRATSPRLGSQDRSVMTGATAPDVSAGTALAYIVHTDDDSVYVGVSSGYHNLVNGTATVRVGQAVDAFYPVGRPVFRRT